MENKTAIREEAFPLATLVMNEIDQEICGFSKKKFSIEYIEPSGEVIEYYYDTQKDMEKDWIMFQEFATPVVPVVPAKRGRKPKVTNEMPNITFISIPLKANSKYVQLAFLF